MGSEHEWWQYCCWTVDTGHADILYPLFVLFVFCDCLYFEEEEKTKTVGSWVVDMLPPLFKIFSHEKFSWDLHEMLRVKWSLKLSWICTKIIIYGFDVLLLYESELLRSRIDSPCQRAVPCSLPKQVNLKPRQLSGFLSHFDAFRWNVKRRLFIMHC